MIFFIFVSHVTVTKVQKCGPYAASTIIYIYIHIYIYICFSKYTYLYLIPFDGSNPSKVVPYFLNFWINDKIVPKTKLTAQKTEVLFVFFYHKKNKKKKTKLW